LFTSTVVRNTYTRRTKCRSFKY